MIKREEYIIGNGPAPDWCRGLLMHYAIPGGRIGIEFHGRDRDFELRKGDALIRDSSGRISVRRKVRE